MNNYEDDDKQKVVFNSEDPNIIIGGNSGGRNYDSWFEGRMVEWLVKHSFGFFKTKKQAQVFLVILVIFFFYIAIRYTMKTLSIPFGPLG